MAPDSATAGAYGGTSQIVQNSGEEAHRGRDPAIEVEKDSSGVTAGQDISKF